MCRVQGGGVPVLLIENKRGRKEKEERFWEKELENIGKQKEKIRKEEQIKKKK